MDEIKLPDLPVVSETTSEPTVEKKEIEQTQKSIPFELRLTETDVQTGSIPITWCVDSDWLKNHDPNQYVLLSVAPESKTGSRAEWRGWAKLSDLMAYITFYRPGKNVIAARVTSSNYELFKWMDRSSDKSCWLHMVISFPRAWEDKENHRYEIDPGWSNAYDYSKDPQPQNYLHVDLPTDCFAPEPSDFEKRWVNFFFRQKAVDQCEFRRRRIIAYTLQPIAFVLAFVIYTVAISVMQLAYMMVGKWIVWKNLFTTDTEMDRVVDFLKVKSFKKFEYLFSVAPLTALVGLFLFMISHCKLFLLSAPIILVAVPFFAFVMFLVSKIGIKIMKWFNKKIPQITEQNNNKAKLRKEIIIAKEREYIDWISCSSDKKITSIKDLPKKKRTIKLRFMAVKSAICKPYAH